MKKYLVVVLLLVSVVTLTGCGTTTEIEKENAADRQEMTNSEINECKKWCNIIANDDTKKNDCYTLCETSKKLESNDISDCENIEETSNGFITKDICLQDKAIQTKNADVCDAIENEMNKDACFMGLANDLNDKSICERLASEILKTTCVEENTEE